MLGEDEALDPYMAVSHRAAADPAITCPSEPTVIKPDL